MACLDTTILIDLVSRNAEWRKRAFAAIEKLQQQEQSLATTRFNAAELYVGVERCVNSAAEQRIVDKLLADVEVLEFDNRGARIFGQITAYLQSIGKPAGDMDVLIASTALACGHRKLITRNKIHFSNIPEIEVEDY
jgi:predicted nucleic acid-binding protein